MGDTVDETDASQSANDLINITIKRLHSQTYTLSVPKCVRILALKEEIACVSGVILELQRLIFRGRRMRDYQFLSDYHVEEGHNLYLVVRPPIPRLPETARQRFLRALNFPVQSSDHDSNLGPVIPDSLTTLTEYLTRDNSQTSRNSVGNEHDSGPTRENQIPRPAYSDYVLQTRRQLVIGEVSQCLSSIVGLLGNHVNHVNPTDLSFERLMREGNAIESELLLTNLGNSLVELGRATSRIVMGETPETGYVTVDPTMIISPTGQNRLQSSQSPLQTSTGAGNLQVATTATRNAEIRKHVKVRFQWPEEAELEYSDSEDEYEDEDEDEMVKTVTSLDICI